MRTRCLGLLAAAWIGATWPAGAQDASPPHAIDRQVLVSRHDVHWTSLTGETPLGNGNFAFNADGTGLQTFGGSTMSHWCWHKFPLPKDSPLADLRDKPWAALDQGRLRGPTTPPVPNVEDWLYPNPSPLNLSRLGFVDAEGRRLVAADCASTGRDLDLWRGQLTSRFTYRGEPVEVQTCVDRACDLVAVRVKSSLLQKGALRLSLDFPSPSAQGSHDPRALIRPWVGDFSNLANHRTEIVSQAPDQTLVKRVVNDTIYWVQVAGHGLRPLVPTPATPPVVRARWGAAGGKEFDVTAHVRQTLARTGEVPASNTEFGDPAPGASKRLEIVTRAADGVQRTEAIPEDGFWAPADSASPNRLDFDLAGPSDTYEFCCAYSAAQPAPEARLPGFNEVRVACAQSWPRFWRSGGAIDLSGSRDPRWRELERRIVLSQYELAVQSAGDQPPAEAGLTGLDPWAAKFHLEMTWWHLAHYALWDRWPMAEKALGFYQRNLSVAQTIARHFTYKGALWPKAVGPDAIHSGYPIELIVMWRQPHPIFFAELAYRRQPTPATLAKWRDVVLQSAEMMADYPDLDPKTGRYSLGPLLPACEFEVAKDTVFELAYWRWGLLKAQEWRERLGLQRDPHWDEVVQHLAPLPVQDGKYVYRADKDDTYTRRSYDHIDPVGAFAMFPPVPGLDVETAHHTLLEFARNWNWDATWGWDFPWMAMGAARMGEPGIAVDALLNPSSKNQYDESGLNHYRDFAYLPGNGGLLYAVAMMAAGWDGAPDRPAPGFPDDGSWTVRWEGLQRAP